MAFSNLSLPGIHPKDRDDVADLKKYLRVLVGELEYILTHLGSDNFVSGIVTTDRRNQEAASKIENLEKVVSKSRIQYGQLTVTTAGATVSQQLILLDRSYSAVDGYVVLTQMDGTSAEDFKVWAEKVDGGSFRIRYLTSKAGNYTIQWITVGK